MHSVVYNIKKKKNPEEEVIPEWAGDVFNNYNKTLKESVCHCGHTYLLIISIQENN